MKLIAALALTAALVAGLAACGTEGPADPGQANDTQDSGAQDSAAPGTSLSGVPGGDPADVDRAAALTSVQREVSSVAPALESFYRGKPYPQTLAEAQGSLADAGIELMIGNTVGGYAYDAAATEFTLCIEGPSGAWATYDTAPMSLREGAENGGCPAGLQ